MKAPGELLKGNEPMVSLLREMDPQRQRLYLLDLWDAAHEADAPVEELTSLGALTIEVKRPDFVATR